MFYVCIHPAKIEIEKRTFWLTNRVPKQDFDLCSEVSFLSFLALGEDQALGPRSVNYLIDRPPNELGGGSYDPIVIVYCVP